MKSRAVLIILAVIVAVMGCSEAWAYDTTAFTTVYDTTPWSPALINQFIGPLNRTEQMLRANFSDTTADIDSTGIEDSAIITSKYKNASILDRHIADTASIGYGKVERNPSVPYLNSIQYDSPLISDTSISYAYIQMGTITQKGNGFPGMLGTVSFPSSFDDTPVFVLAQYAGASSDSTVLGTTISAYEDGYSFIEVGATTNTGFGYQYYRTESATFNTALYYFFNWVAFGRRD